MKTQHLRSLLPGICLIFAACQTCKIEPPALTDNRDKTVAAGIAANLQQLNATGELKSDYRNVVIRTFGTLSDDNAALYLLLQAANCAQQHGQAELAQQLVATARERYRQTQGIQSTVSTTSTQLTATEVKSINRSPNAPQIKSAFRETASKSGGQHPTPNVQHSTSNN